MWEEAARRCGLLGNTRSRDVRSSGATVCPIGKNLGAEMDVRCAKCLCAVLSRAAMVWNTFMHSRWNLRGALGFMNGDRARDSVAYLKLNWI